MLYPQKGDMYGLLHHLNNIYPTIKFTMKMAEGGSSPFLDTNITRKTKGKLDITDTCTLGLTIKHMKRDTVWCFTTVPDALHRGDRTWKKWRTTS